MRRPTGRRSPSPVRVVLSEFGWDAATLAATRHATLPWFDVFAPEIDLAAVSLAGRRWAPRDALSLIGQYAAHLAFLRFLGIDSGRFDAAEWVVATQRGCDSRLIRIRAASPAGEESPSLEALEAMAAEISAPELASLHDTWGKPEQPDRDVLARLSEDAAADLSWLRAAASGEHVSPGIDHLRTFGPGSILVMPDGDASALDAICRFAAINGSLLLVLGGQEASPLRPLSALAGLEPVVGSIGKKSDGEIVERIVRVAERRPSILAVTAPERFDSRSRGIVRMLVSTLATAAWLVPEEFRDLIPERREVSEPLPSRVWVVAPTLSSFRRLEEELARLPPGDRSAWIDQFIRQPAYERFLRQEEVPRIVSHAGLEGVREPARSYLAALALLGAEVDAELAAILLGRLGGPSSIEGLMVPGILEGRAGLLHFVSEGIASALGAELPSESQSAILRMAGEIENGRGETVRAARFLARGGDLEAAAAIISLAIAEGADPDALAAEENLPLDLVEAVPRLAFSRGRMLIRKGRYRQARRLGAALGSPERNLVLALAERRLGNYGAALELLDEMPTPDFESTLLRAELHRLCGAEREAEAALEQVADLARSSAEKAGVGYERAMLDLDRDAEPDGRWASRKGAPPWLTSRFRAYVALNARDSSNAIEQTRKAIAHAETVPEAIDGQLDLMYALFLAGEWVEARHTAREGLALVEESEGDRAGGGFLFTLAYLCADEGQWEQSRHQIARLRRFYQDRGDSKRFAEIDLLEAQLLLGRLDLGEAARAARRVVASGCPSEIRHAAHLVLDEVDWLQGDLPMVRTTDEVRCLELRNRHLLHVSRAAGAVDPRLTGSWHHDLARWETDVLAGSEHDPPRPATGSQRLRLLRSLVGIGRRKPGSRWSRDAEQLATDLGLAVPREYGQTHSSMAAELELLQLLAAAPFPPDPSALGARGWRLVSRNRLGQWTECGSLAPLGPEELEDLLIELPPDWIEAGERRWFHLQGLDHWSRATRDAIATLIRTRVEHHNFERLLEQESDTVADRPSRLRGAIVGESPAIQAVLEKIDLVAGRDIPVCIEGESGTGKELIARAIHAASPRRNRQFTAVNCAALPENLIESELFGHVRGAFTGADRDRAGLIESSDGGTLFLDEIGEMPLAAQAKLLRFLQEGEVRRVGETAARKADVRIVAATNRLLEQAADAGSFRQDLYYR
ncbi:MAG TPA: sigma-54 factor interaction domain-containing protein, partial [Thermoanaerobaculia bacterium]|nr:sigma-54 factor interaction domain-containing protein [Thermoanaerobaculia bacterium]